MDQDEKLWHDFNDWHKARYGWRVHENLRNNQDAPYYAWQAWLAGFAHGTKTQNKSTERVELERVASDLNRLRARVEGVLWPDSGMAYRLPCDVSDSGLGT